MANFLKLKSSWFFSFTFFFSFFRIFSSRYCKWGKLMRIWNPSIDLPTYLCFDHLEMFWQINLLSWLSGAFLFYLDARLRLWSFKILSSDVALIIILQKVPRTFVKAKYVILSLAFHPCHDHRKWHLRQPTFCYKSTKTWYLIKDN